ncbi:hypothetical protein [Tardiphaga sp.]|uniref:hypothetical protein n=1 Tax=Tardiphaga sp. TaxID=1926292 RepID=UPI0037DA1DAA
MNISLSTPPERPPELPGLATAPIDIAYSYYLERVPDGVQIGMVRGGAIDSVGGFGFSDGSEVPSWLWFNDINRSGLVALFEDI